MFVNAATKGNIDETTNYNQFNVASVRMQANGGIEANVVKGTDLNTLAQQPGMGWVNQLVSDPALVNSTNWKTVEEAHKKWQTDQSGLGPVSSAIVMLVVAVATAGAGTAAAGTAGAGTTAGTGMAGAMGLTAGQTAILTGAMQAGITALAGQATVSFMNNGGNLAKVFDELGSSQSVKNLLTAMVTGGALAGLTLNPVTGQATANSGQQLFVDQLAQNVKGGVATALIRTAINGGSLEDALKDSLKSAFLSTIAAQTANEIGNLDGFMNKLAHAIAGCAVGAASAGNGGGCASGAIGAVIGELTAEAMGKRDDTVAVASLMAGLAAAVAGGDATQVNLAAGAGGNAAANNYLSHDEAAQRERLKDKQRQGKTLTTAEQQTLDNFEVLDIARDLALRDACSTPGDACNAARRALNAALSSYTGAAAMTDANLSTAGNAAVAGERDQSIALGNDPSLAAQGFLDGFLEFAVPQLAGYAIGGALGAYVNEARALYAAIKSESGSAATAAVTIGAGAVNPALLNELTANGVKFTPGNVIAVARSSSGQVVFLETGNSAAGLRHIVQEHGPEFASMGISEAQIPSVVMRTVTEGTVVGYQGSGTGRPIYELLINGQSQRIAITVGSNGFIVGANPRGAGR